MGDYKDLPNGRQDPVYTHDEGDGSYSRAAASHLRGWDATDTAWYRLPVDHATGALQVVIAGGAGSGGTSSTDGAAYTAGSSAGTPLMGARDDAASGTVAEDKLGIARITTNRALHVNLRDAAGAEVSVGGGTQYDEDTASTAADKITMAGVVRKDTAATLVDTDGDRTQLQVTASGKLWTSATVDAALPAGTNAIGKLAANDGVDVGDVTVNNASGGSAVNIQDGGNSLTVDNGGTFAVQATVAAAATNVAKAEDVASADADVGIPAMAVRKAAPANTSGTDGDYEMLQMAAGRLWVDPSGVTLTVASHAVTNAGTFVVQENGAALTSLQLLDDTIIADDAAFTVGTTKVSGAGFLADETSTDSVDEGDMGAARMTLDRKLIVTVEPHTAGGWDTFMASSGDGSTALTNTAQQVKGTPGKLGGWYIYNPNATAAYVIIYNVASASVTVGTTNPRNVICIPATSAANLELVNGVTYDTAISVAAVTTGGGSTAPGTALEANFFYK